MVWESYAVNSTHLAAILVMLKNFLTDELTLAVAVGSEPNRLGGAQCLANGFELAGFVSALCRASAIKAPGRRRIGDQRFQAGTTSSGSSRSNK
jgi:hypothetical protein